MEFGIYTMYVNGLELLADAVHSLGRFEDKAVILDNSFGRNLELPDFKGEILLPSAPLFCSQSYGMIKRMALERGQAVFMIMHSDAVASEAIVEGLIARAEELEAKQSNWGVMFTNYDVLCAMNTRTVRDFDWDQYLPLYYTDVDYYRRLELAGIEIIETYLPVIHRNGGSGTLSDPAVKAFTDTNFTAWREYYALKWGGDRGLETFTTPFNR